MDAPASEIIKKSQAKFLCCLKQSFTKFSVSRDAVPLPILIKVTLCFLISFAILFIDLDGFKLINDTYGHEIGDEVLKELSKVLVNSVRDSDFVVRFGGEEFIIILQNIKDKKEIIKVAEKIRKTFENTKIAVNGKTLNKTISIGVSIFPKDTNKIWEAIKFADLALYEAKRSGRNKVVRFKEELDPRVISTLSEEEIVFPAYQPHNHEENPT